MMARSTWFNLFLWTKNIRSNVVRLEVLFREFGDDFLLVPIDEEHWPTQLFSTADEIHPSTTWFMPRGSNHVQCTTFLQTTTASVVAICE